jgi:hypothetical protein
MIHSSISFLTVVLLLSVSSACVEKSKHPKIKIPVEKTVDVEKGKFNQHNQHEENNIKQLPNQESSTTILSTFIGTFSVSVETEATTTGMTSIDYSFTITNESVQLEINTYHEPITCSGTYKAVGKKNLLELYYAGKEEFCNTERPMFFLKEEGGSLYAKGLGGEGTFNDWIKLKRI